jgi:hypothetical protein
LYLISVERLKKVLSGADEEALKLLFDVVDFKCLSTNLESNDDNENDDNDRQRDNDDKLIARARRLLDNASLPVANVVSAVCRIVDTHQSRLVRRVARGNGDDPIATQLLDAWRRYCFAGADTVWSRATLCQHVANWIADTTGDAAARNILAPTPHIGNETVCLKLYF